MFYAYKGTAPLGSEPLGGDGKLLMKDLTSEAGAVRRCRQVFKDASFKLYAYTNFYDNKTFREVSARG